ncbi:NAD(P)-binding protein [Pleomassaria siparia CBS 279.74]|uniref:NAD(P)-binding protein n=1 Tax=Pleomassaria siparia CBS 279.74 TaxID=1314801 RepID=A0A6G1K5U3_9PLEO|nr:NAD(P)-binding protein [Pleomassaria siparia CBS 279.74]
MHKGSKIGSKRKRGLAHDCPASASSSTIEADTEATPESSELQMLSTITTTTAVPLVFGHTPLEISLFDPSITGLPHVEYPDPAIDSHFIVMQSQTTSAAFRYIAELLNLACQQDSGFNITAPISSLPPPLAPTADQLVIPHRPYIDMLPWASFRDRMLKSSAVVNEIEFIVDMANSDLGVWGTMPWDPMGWEIGPNFASKWWFLMDEKTLRTSNFWRGQRGEAPLVATPNIMGGILEQLFPGKPHFTEDNLLSLAGKVYIVTGGNAGVDLELVKMLYAAGGTVWIFHRSSTDISSALKEIEAVPTSNSGFIKSLLLDLSNLTTIKGCASKFFAQELRLDVLWNNAGITRAPIGSVTAQGHEMHMGTNCLWHFLLTKLLLPLLVATARTAPKGSIRVVWASSGIIDMAGPPGGVSLAKLQPGNYAKDIGHNYSASKAGNWFLASELDRRVRSQDIISMTQSPGTLKTKGWDDAPWIMRAMMSPFMYEAKCGAYTELWAGLSGEVHKEDGGKFGVPWGKWHSSPRRDCLDSMKSVEEGGTGIAARLWEWCEKETKAYA